MIEIVTKSGGTVDFSVNRSPINGTTLILHIDQSFNEKNGEDEASISINIEECKDIIAALNDFIKFIEGKDYVYTSESVLNLLEKPEIKSIVEKIYKQSPHETPK